MNIFYLHEEPAQAAQALYDKHVVKMVLETAQLLCAAHHLHDHTFPQQYRLTHASHPCTLWAAKSDSNYAWLYMSFLNIADEFEYRYGKQHLSYLKLADELAFPPPAMQAESQIFTPPPLVMPTQFHASDHVEAYRNYYRTEKAHLYAYTRRTPPAWLVRELPTSN